MLRYTITIKRNGKFGPRVLFRTNQNQNHFDDENSAVQYLNAVKNNNSVEIINQIFGEGAFDTLRVDKAECYTTGDVKTILNDEVLVAICKSAEQYEADFFGDPRFENIFYPIQPLEKVVQELCDHLSETYPDQEFYLIA